MCLPELNLEAEALFPRNKDREVVVDGRVNKDFWESFIRQRVAFSARALVQVQKHFLE